MGDSDIIERLRLTNELMCDIRRNKGMVRSHIYPIYPQIYWQSHRDMDLTEHEVQRILNALKQAKANL